MKSCHRAALLSLMVSAIGFSGLALAQDAPTAPAPARAPAANLEPLVVSAVKVGDALAAANAGEGRTVQLRRVAEGLDAQLRSAITATRKFRVVAGSNYKEQIDRQALINSGTFNQEDPNAAKVGELRPPKYQVITNIDDFQDVAQQLAIEGQGAVSTGRSIRLSLVMTVVDINTGEELETVPVTVRKRKVTERLPGVSETGDSKDALLQTVTAEAAAVAANRVADVIYPAKIIAMTDKTVTINRGDGTSVAVGQVWDSFALGESLVDPDTGSVLGKEEVPSGKIKITSVQAKFSKGTVIEDKGIDKGQVLRMHLELAPDQDAN
jgi:hypothetical protein